MAQSTPAPRNVKNYLSRLSPAKACKNSACVRGQRLFVRPIERGDEEAIRAFLAAYGGGPLPRQGLIGKLVGELVAVLAFDLAPGQASVTQLVVAAPLRRKRIGRVMLDELAALCRKLEIDRIVARSSGADAFFRRTGFREAGPEWIREVSRS